MAESLQRFHWADYVVFVLILGISMSTGVYFGVIKKQKRSTEEFLMASRNMHIVPVSFSLFVSWMSAISFLGGPVECYSYGFIYLIMVVGYIIAIPPVAIWFAPYFNKLRIISAFEFLETRYNKTFRRIASFAMAVMNIVWLGIATYAPALALSQASGIPLTGSIILIGTVCTFYTALGGMKAVLWADTIQFFIMLIGQLAIVIRGCIVVGGVGELFRIAQAGGRMNMLDSVGDFNPLLRISFWTYLIGGVFRVFVPYISYQMLVQRYCTVKGPKEASNMTWLNLPMYALMSTLIAVNGLVLYAIYHDCDPLLSGRIERRDQMVPLAVIELLGILPGFPGLFMATIFCASLSSMSSGMNGLAANLLRDFVQPAYQYIKGTPMPDNMSTYFAKSFALMFGVMITGVSFLPKALGSSIFALTQLTVGTIAGPVAGAFFMAIVAPHVRTMPVVIGFILALCINMWIGIGGFFVAPRGEWEQLPLSTAGCPVPSSNVTTSHYSALGGSSNFTVKPDLYTAPSTGYNKNEPFHITDVYYWHPLLYYVSGLLITIMVAGIVHFCLFIYYKIKPPQTPDSEYDKVASDQINKDAQLESIPLDEKCSAEA